MKLANSAFFGGRHRVGSVRQALMTLGSVAVARRRCSCRRRERPPEPPAELGLLRARLCELVAAARRRRARARLYGRPVPIVDALLGTRMHLLLDDLRSTSAPAARSVSTWARRPSAAGVLAYERGDFEDCAAAGVSLIDIARAYGEALDWTDGALLQLTA